MIDLDNARAKLHRLIDQLPDEQIAMIWVTFQSMFGDDFVDDEEEDEDGLTEN